MLAALSKTTAPQKCETNIKKTTFAESEVYYFNREIDITKETDKGEPEQIITISQKSIGDESCIVWDAALCFGFYCIDRFPKMHWKHKKVLEFGAGTGVVGIMLAKIGATAYITDLPEVLPLINRNLELNFVVNNIGFGGANVDSVAQLNENKNKTVTMNGNVSSFPLDWSKFSTDMNAAAVECSQMDLIVLVDCLYYEDSLTFLNSSLREAIHPNLEIWVCYEIRPDKQKIVDEFFEMLSDVLIFEQIPTESQSLRYSADDIIIKIGRSK